MLSLDKQKKYLLACSYGPDSMALFHMLANENISFGVAHVNYHKRDVSNFEEESLRKYCKAFNVAIHVLDTNTIKKPSGNFQGWAREVRYKFFQKVVKEQTYDVVLVAHHLDDALETYLMQKERKSIVDYYGIKEDAFIFGCHIKRPLLSYTKDELTKYCNDNKVLYSIDVSNLSNDYKRNKIRHEVIEKLQKDEKLLLLKEASEQNRHLDEVKKKLDNIIEENKIKCEELFKYKSEDIAILLNYYLKLNNVNYLLSKRNIDEICKAFLCEKSHVKIKLNKEFNLIKDYKMIKIGNNVSVGDYIFIVKEPAILDNEIFYLNLKENYQQFRIKEDDFPLTIRNVRQGDLSHINNITKKVSRLYVDWKMPRGLRKKWPLIFNKNQELVYIIRYYGEESLSRYDDFIVKKE